MIFDLLIIKQNGETELHKAANIIMDQSKKCIAYVDSHELKSPLTFTITYYDEFPIEIEAASIRIQGIDSSSGVFVTWLLTQ